MKDYIEKWEGMGYSAGIPDTVPARLEQLRKAPSYKNIAFAILKNDTRLIGTSPPKSDWYSVLKAIELQPGKNRPRQMKLFRH